ncbi:MAG TPA: folate/biopterin family MFS transporter, partial [Vicinamibacteria bacterium]|nr:folate/biopterin family MFS transporter [Vicinamibacteria bacterium]
MTLKDTGLSAGQVASFFLVTTFAWNVKPVYGLLSDFVPLFGSRRKAYFLLTTGLTAVSGASLALSASHPYGWLMLLFGLMGLGLAFTDVLTDAMMVESGRAQGLT